MPRASGDTGGRTIDPGVSPNVVSAGGTTLELSTIYSYLGNSTVFRDITSGTAGSYKAGSGWDFVTGVGSNQGLGGK